MSSTTLKRLGGLSLLVGGIIVIAGIVPPFFLGSDQTSAASAASALARLIGAMLVVLGLPGVYAGESLRFGKSGLIGFIATSLFFLMALATEPIFAFVFPYLATKAPAVIHGGPPPALFIFFIIDGVLELVGGVLLGIAALRAGRALRWPGGVLILGALVSFFGSFLANSVGDIGTILLIIGLFWLTVNLRPASQAAIETITPPASMRA